LSRSHFAFGGKVHLPIIGWHRLSRSTLNLSTGGEIGQFSEIFPGDAGRWSDYGYYYGNAFSTMADDPAMYPYYRAIYKCVKKTLTKEDVDALK
jgi:hypothetical protein